MRQLTPATIHVNSIIESALDKLREARGHDDTARQLRREAAEALAQCPVREWHRRIEAAGLSVETVYRLVPKAVVTRRKP